MKVISVAFAAMAVILGLVQCKDKLPTGMSQHQYCLGCIATVKELEKAISKRHLTDRNRESKIMEIMENICKPPNFVEYEYSPPKTVKACEYLLENHEEDLESALVKQMKNVENLICYEYSKACEGIDPTKKNKDSKMADIDLSGSDGEEVVSKTVKVDPTGGGVILDGEEKSAQAKKNEGKTLSKKSKKKTDKKKKAKKSKSDSKKPNSGKPKGAINHINVDINDPDSLAKITQRIQEMTGQPVGENNNKDEL